MNFRNILIGAASVAAVAAIAGSAAAQTSTGNSASADITVSAKVVKALALSNITSLDFGTVVSPGSTSNDTVTMDASGTRGGTAVLVAGSSNAGHAGSFKVNGDKNNTFSTQVSTVMDEGYTLTPALTSSDCTMTSNAPTGTGTADSCTVAVGGSLKIPVNASGSLANSKITITVTYN